MNDWEFLTPSEIEDINEMMAAYLLATCIITRPTRTTSPTGGSDITNALVYSGACWVEDKKRHSGGDNKEQPVYDFLVYVWAAQNTVGSLEGTPPSLTAADNTTHIRVGDQVFVDNMTLEVVGPNPIASMQTTLSLYTKRVGDANVQVAYQNNIPVLVVEDDDNQFIFRQETPLSEWIVNHNRGQIPEVAVYGLDMSEVEAEINHTSQNQLRVRFTMPFAGICICT
jgi:hypothetical protein